MTTPRKHRHADLIRRWLDDDSLEVEWKNGDTWSLLRPNTVTWDDECDYRFKSKMIKCGDLEFPEPMRVAPVIGTKYWTTEIHAIAKEIAMVDHWDWDNDEQDMECLRVGICHLTRAAAEQHARALIALTEIKE